MPGRAVDASCFIREARQHRKAALRAPVKPLFDTVRHIANDHFFPRTRSERSRVGDPLEKPKTKG
jgi:hypothetical protein